MQSLLGHGLPRASLSEAPMELLLLRATMLSCQCRQLELARVLREPPQRATALCLRACACRRAFFLPARLCIPTHRLDPSANKFPSSSHRNALSLLSLPTLQRATSTFRSTKLPAATASRSAAQHSEEELSPAHGWKAVFLATQAAASSNASRTSGPDASAPSLKPVGSLLVERLGPR